MVISDFERQVLYAITEGAHEALQVLRAQAISCEVTGRELTGHGFFTSLNVSSIAPRLAHPKLSCCFGDVHAQLEGVKWGAGFLLWLEDGLLVQLEGYTYGEEQWPRQPILRSWRHQYSEEERVRQLLEDCTAIQ